MIQYVLSFFESNITFLGWVHYHNDEVAEVAAKEMNGKIICGKKVQTKGPKHFLLSASTASFDLTDCYYFILNGHCQPKQGQVSYLHVIDFFIIDIISYFINPPY